MVAGHKLPSGPASHISDVGRVLFWASQGIQEFPGTARNRVLSIGWVGVVPSHIVGSGALGSILLFPGVGTDRRPLCAAML